MLTSSVLEAPALQGQSELSELGLALSERPLKEPILAIVTVVLSAPLQRGSQGPGPRFGLMSGLIERAGNLMSGSCDRRQIMSIKAREAKKGPGVHRKVSGSFPLQASKGRKVAIACI